ncbi:restriction endonuclease subunit S [Sulfitobacter sp.]|uniref:restriction endonuclease subunit S n=1 Tax=Sulfitobacter sp. TaxID=1903071 RepID=UPI003001B2CA
MVPKLKLHEFIDIKHGFAFSSDFFRDKATDYILLTPGNFHVDQRLYFGQRTKYYDGPIPNGYVLKNGDLLVVMTDLTKDMAILGNAVLLNSDKLVLHNQRIGLVQIKDEVRVEKRFLCALLNSDIVQKYVRATASGTTVRHTAPKRILEIPAHIPPLPEQRKIADILSTWDRAIETSEALLATARTQKRALMQSLLSGKGRFSEFGEHTGHSNKVPKGWDVLPLSSVCDVKGGKRIPKGQSLSEAPTSHPYIRVSDMRDGYVDTSDIRYVPDEIAPSISRYRISKDDLFISVAGTLGLVGKIQPELDGANLTENADKLTNISIDREFLLTVLQSPWVQRPIQNEKTSNAQPKLALERIRGFRIPVPSLPEQRKIAAVLTDCQHEIEKLKLQIVKLRTEKKALMQQLLTGKRRVNV